MEESREDIDIQLHWEIRLQLPLEVYGEVREKKKEEGIAMEERKRHRETLQAPYYLTPVLDSQL